MTDNELEVLESKIVDAFPTKGHAYGYTDENLSAASMALDNLIAEVKRLRVRLEPVASAGKAWQIPDFGDQIRQGISDRDFRSWFVFEAMSAFRGEGYPNDFLERYFSKDGSMPGEVVIELRVNGQPTNTEAVFDHMKAVFEQLILDKARELLEQKLGKVGDLLETFRRETTHAMREAYPDAHYSDDDND
jgi:hypothetical protein